MKLLFIILLASLASCKPAKNDDSQSAKAYDLPDSTNDYNFSSTLNIVELAVGTYKSECYVKYGRLHGYKIIVRSDYTLTIMEMSSLNNYDCDNYEYMISSDFNINGENYDFTQSRFFNQTQEKTICNLPKVNYALNIDGISCSESYEFKTVEFIEQTDGKITFNSKVLTKL